MTCANPGKLWKALYLTCGAILIGISPAQEPASPRTPPEQLVREVVHNEVTSSGHPSIPQMFRSQKQTSKGLQTHLYVETKDAMAGMLIAMNGQPLTPAQKQSEMKRLDWLCSNPDQLRKKKAREKEDADRTLQIVKVLPDAFLYEYAPAQNGIPPSQVRLNFRPNPSFSPPSHVEAALEGMQGYLLVDTQARRIARIDGTLFKDVTFGWGIVGRLDKGGHFVVSQADVGNGAWEITEMHLDIKGKILLFKTLSMVSDEVFTGFRPVPDTLTFAQGVDMLKAEEVKLAHAASPAPEQRAEQKNPR